MKSKPRREKVNTTLKESTIDNFDKFCEDNNINKSKLIEKLLKDHIKSKK